MLQPQRRAKWYAGALALVFALQVVATIRHWWGGLSPWLPIGSLVVVLSGLVYYSARGHGHSRREGGRRAALICGCFLVAGSNVWVGRRLPAEAGAIAGVLLATLAGVALLVQAVRFDRIRELWTRPLVYAPTSALEKTLAILLIPLAASIAYDSWPRSGEAPPWWIIGLAPLLVVGWLELAANAFLGLRIAIAGVCTLSGLVRWDEIHSYRWHEDGHVSLRLKQRPAIWTLLDDPLGYVSSSKRFYVGRDDHEAVSQVLAKQLDRPALPNTAAGLPRTKEWSEDRPD